MPTHPNQPSPSLRLSLHESSAPPCLAPLFAGSCAGFRRGSKDDERRLRKAATPRGEECAGGAVVLQHRVVQFACDEEVAVRAERHALGLIEAAEAGGDED